MHVLCPTPDGGEGLGRERKGYSPPRWGLKRSVDQMGESMDKNRVQGVCVGREQAALTAK